MKVKEFIKKLERFNQDAEVFLGSDEELNSIYSGVLIDYLINDKMIVIWADIDSEIKI